MKASLLLKRELNKQMECAHIRSPQFDPHFHSHIELYLILSGEIEVLVNDQKKLLGPGELAVSMSYDTHGYRTPKQAEALWITIPTDFCKDYLPLFAERRLPSPYLNDPTVVQTVAAAIEQLIKKQDNEITQRGLLYLILGAIYSQMIPKDKTKDLPAHDSSAEVLIYIGEHFREDLTLSSVAKKIGYHPAYLSRYFRTSFGISFVRYLSMVRLREAVLLLQKESRNVTECAIESGFGSIRSFYRAFYAEFGCTPTEYLKRTEEGRSLM